MCSLQVSDKRLILAQSSEQDAIAQLGEKNLPCRFVAVESGGKKHALIHSHTRFVAVESEPFFHKGARPARRRARHIYDKSGKEGSLMSLGKYRQDDERPLP